MKPWPIKIATSQDVEARATVWRYRKRLSLTVIVKATFSLVPDGPLALSAPSPVTLDDRTFGGLPTRSVEAACETWPYLGRCDVTFVGSAYSGGRASSAARLALYRDGRALVDKTIHVFGDRDASGAPTGFSRLPVVYERARGGIGDPTNPVGTDKPNFVDPRAPDKPAVFAPISRHWPARKRLLPEAMRQTLDAPVLELPDDAPWAYFQAAPPDQQAELLTGEEWLVLDGLHESSPRLATRLPGAKAEARVISRGATEGTAVELVCDTLAIDGDKGRCSLVWRGRFELQGGTEALEELAVVAALSWPGRSIEWVKLAEAARASAPVVATEKARTNVGEETGAIDEVASKRSAVPFSARAPEVGSDAGKRASAEATPFSGVMSRPAPPPSAEGTIAAASRGEATIAAPQGAAGLKPIAPFAIEPPKPDEKPDVSATPWGNTKLSRAPVVLAGEGTLAAGAMVGRDEPARPQPIPQPIPQAQPLPPPPPPPPPQAQPPPPPPPQAQPSPSPVSRLNASAPAIVQPAPVVARKRSVAWTPAAVADGLRGAGVDAQDIADLLSALSPPPPPPDEL